MGNSFYHETFKEEYFQFLIPIFIIYIINKCHGICAINSWQFVAINKAGINEFMIRFTILVS